MKRQTRLRILQKIRRQDLTLKDLASSEHTFWRFSQSERGRSRESHYAKYEPGVITYAENKDKWLSFVDDAHIVHCFMYGDMLTKLIFDLNNQDFRGIQSCRVNNLASSFGEYECKKLLTEINYSLSDVKTIRLFFSMVNDNRQFIEIFFGSDNLEDKLRRFGFGESAELVHYLKGEFRANNYLFKDGVMELIDEYINRIHMDFNLMSDSKHADYL